MEGTKLKEFIALCERQDEIGNCAAARNKFYLGRAAVRKEDRPSSVVRPLSAPFLLSDGRNVCPGNASAKAPGNARVGKIAVAGFQLAHEFGYVTRSRMRTQQARIVGPPHDLLIRSSLRPSLAHADPAVSGGAGFLAGHGVRAAGPTAPVARGLPRAVPVFPRPTRMRSHRFARRTTSFCCILNLGLSVQLAASHGVAHQFFRFARVLTVLPVPSHDRRRTVGPLRYISYRDI